MRSEALRRIFVLILAFAFLISLPAVCVCAADSPSGSGRTVKVAVIPYPLYAEQDENGIWTGYDIEMMEKIAQLADFNIQFVPVSTVQDIYDGLADGSIDIAGNIEKNTEREEKYLFSEHEQGNSSLCMLVKQDSDTVDYGDISQFAGLRFAVSDGQVETQFLQWCGEHGISPEYTVYQTPNEVFSVIDSGEADVAVTADDSGAGGRYRIVLAFDQTSYYYIFNKDDSAIKNELDAAVAKILMQNPLYENTLKQKYGISINNAISFTREEKEYISAHPNITVAAVENDRPYFSTGSDGKAKGILPDLYAEIADNTGFTFTFKAYTTQQEAAGRSRPTPPPTRSSSPRPSPNTGSCVP